MGSPINTLSLHEMQGWSFGQQNFPATASQWRNHKNTQYFTHLPQPAMMQAYIRQSCHQGPHKEGKWSQNKKEL